MPFSIRLFDWQNHERLEIEAHKPVTLLTGVNASGKSAILDALEFVLLGTGTRRGIKTKKELALLSIRDDAARTSVELDLPMISIARSMGRDAAQKVRVAQPQPHPADPPELPVGEGDRRIAATFDLEPAQIRAALEAHAVLSGDEQERRALFVAAAGAEITRERLAEALSGTGLDEGPLNFLVDSAIADGFAAAARHAQNERARRSGAIAELPAAAPSHVWKPEWAAEPIQLDRLTAVQLDERAASLDAVIDEAERQIGGSIGRIEADLTAAKARRADLIAEGERLSEEQEALKNAVGAAEIARAAAIEAETRAAQAKAALTALEHEAALIEQGAEIEAPDECPAIVGNPKCPMTKGKLDAHRKALQKRAADLPALVEGARCTRDGLREEAFTALTTKTEAETRERRLHDVENRVDEILEAVDAIEAEIARLGEMLTNPPKGSGSDPDKTATWARARRERLRETVSKKNAYDEAKAAFAQTSERRAKLEREHAAFDRAAKLLAPDGLPSEIFGERARALEDFIAEIAGVGNGHGIGQFRFNSDVEIEARVGDRWRRYVQLSESWRLRVSIVASHVIARAAGFPMLIVDRFDHLDGPGRRAAIDGVIRVADHYPAGVLVLATLGRARPQATGLADVETLWLRDGTVERIG